EEPLDSLAPLNESPPPDVPNAAAPETPASRLTEALPVVDFRPEERPVSFADESWMALAEQSSVPLPVLVKNSSPSLAPAAMAALALGLGIEWRPPRRSGRLRQLGGPFPL